MDKFYITTAIDYVNDTIHIGHAFQKVIADVLARYWRIKLGEDNVFFLTGTDEYGRKALKAAIEAGISPKEFVDKIAESDQKEQDSLNISYNRFVRTTDPDHTKVVQEIWRRVDEGGDIYLGEYTGLYCEGCEAYYTEEDLVDGKCPFHPTLTIKQVTEKNYFFKWSKYRDFLIEHIKSHPEFILPESRKNEMLKFAQNIKDIPVSRTNFKWGIPVPNDPEQVIYVWFDALTNYLTGIGFLEETQKFKKFWPADVHILGKDNIRWHTLLWPAMLKSAGIELPKTILVNGFLSLNGEKISKSSGNIIRPSDWVSKFGIDAVRYYLLQSGPITEDSDISEEKLKTAYNANLANGLGNLLERVFKMVVDYGIPINDKNLDRKITGLAQETESKYHEHFGDYNLFEVLKVIFGFMKELDRYVNEKEPWNLYKNKDAELEPVLNSLFHGIEEIIKWISPFMPAKAGVAQKYAERVRNGEISKEEKLNLFPRITS